MAWTNTSIAQITGCLLPIAQGPAIAGGPCTGFTASGGGFFPANGLGKILQFSGRSDHQPSILASMNIQRSICISAALLFVFLLTSAAHAADVSKPIWSYHIPDERIPGYLDAGFTSQLVDRASEKDFPVARVVAIVMHGAFSDCVSLRDPRV